MLSIWEVIQAVDILNGKANPNVDQILMTLKLYKDRGEFDGTLVSAIKCLEQAEYELTNIVT